MDFYDMLAIAIVPLSCGILILLLGALYSKIKKRSNNTNTVIDLPKNTKLEKCTALGNDIWPIVFTLAICAFIATIILTITFVCNSFSPIWLIFLIGGFFYSLTLFVISGILFYYFGDSLQFDQTGFVYKAQRCNSEHKRENKAFVAWEDLLEIHVAKNTVSLTLRNNKKINLYHLRQIQKFINHFHMHHL